MYLSVYIKTAHKFSNPFVKLALFTLQSIKESVRIAKLHFWKAIAIIYYLYAFNHASRRPPTTIAISKDKSPHIASPLVQGVVLGCKEIRDSAIVGKLRQKEIK
jgi:hypothetical protein